MTLYIEDTTQKERNDGKNQNTNNFKLELITINWDIIILIYRMKQSCGEKCNETNFMTKSSYK